MSISIEPIRAQIANIATLKEKHHKGKAGLSSTIIAEMTKLSDMLSEGADPCPNCQEAVTEVDEAGEIVRHILKHDVVEDGVVKTVEEVGPAKIKLVPCKAMGLLKRDAFTDNLGFHPSVFEVGCPNCNLRTQAANPTQAVQDWNAKVYTPAKKD